MQEIIKKLKALYAELNDAYEEYLESEYDNNAPKYWNSEDRCYEGPDFENWTSKNCFNFYDFANEKADEDLMEEIETVLSVVFPEDD